MMTDTELRIRGFQALTNALGNVEAERYVALIMRERFDYTKWQKDLWADKSVEEISSAAMQSRRSAA